MDPDISSFSKLPRPPEIPTQFFAHAAPQKSLLLQKKESAPGPTLDVVVLRKLEPQHGSQVWVVFKVVNCVPHSRFSTKEVAGLQEGTEQLKSWNVFGPTWSWSARTMVEEQSWHSGLLISQAKQAAWSLYVKELERIDIFKALTRLKERRSAVFPSICDPETGDIALTHL
ncbi:hypothetical protein B0H14DRAFT_2590086 [Mycena olivaceomarginata]|nr:hypothetical protein B0H14DRAFT_2590086 [Mycena olivaceomarginata]